ncbi:hypothetical protein Slin14017_G114740 [Septoria linicola]|nr:hypothetical protein Slin14017_G114740 [Septoria linicola]
MTITDTIKDAAQAVGLGNGANGESKSARKKKAKAEAAANNGTSPDTTAVPKTSSPDASVAANDSNEDPVLVELQKKVRNTNKKLQGMAKVDAILEANPGVSLDDLVAQRKINQDQKAQAQKKPELLTQRDAYERQIEEHNAREAKLQARLARQHAELTAKHEQEVSKLRGELSATGAANAEAELRKKLLTFSQFLRAAAAKRATEGEEDSEESRAFEGALLLVYGGDEKAVDAAVSLIEGSQEKVPSIEGIPTEISFAQVQQAAVKHAPFQVEEEWLDGVEKANAGESVAPAGSDPTITHAGLTELEAPNGAVAETLPEATTAQGTSGEGGNIAGERWNTDAAGTSAGAEKSGLEDSYEIVPRPNEEVDVPAAAPARAQQGTSWAEESHEAATGNKAGESWANKAPGETNGSWGAEPLASATTPGDGPVDDGFSEVASRRGGRGNGREFGRGRGGRGGNYRGRGDGEGRGRGRGGFRGNRGEGGEFRGRGRGPRGGAPAAPTSS